MLISTRVLTLANKIVNFLKLLPLKFYFIAVLLLALILRLWGVWHGLPYIYSVDEPALVHSVLGLRFDLNPHHFDWPHFHFYLSYLVFGIFYKMRVAWQVWGWKSAMEAVAPILWNDGAVFYLLLRLLSVFMGALTVIPVFLAARVIFGSNKKALLAALIFALAPFHVESSQYALIDVPATFWAAWSFYFSIKIFRQPKIWFYVLAGFFGGLAASTKYNAVLILLMLVIVSLLRIDSLGSIKRRIINFIKTDFWKLVVAFITSAIAFFIGTPYAMLDFKSFVVSDKSTGALWQLSRSGNRFEWPVISRLWEGLTTKIGGGFGYVALAVAVVGLVVALKLKNKLYRGLAIFSIVFYLYVASSAFSPIQIFMPLYLVLAPLFVIGVSFLMEKLRGELFDSAGAWRVGFWLLILLFILPSLMVAIKIDYSYAKEDTRNIAKEYIDSAIPKGAVIGTDGEDQPFYEGSHPVYGIQAWRYAPLAEKKIEYVVIATKLEHVLELHRSGRFGDILDNINPSFVVYNGGDREGPNIYIYKLNYHLADQWWVDESKVPALNLENILKSDHNWRDRVLPSNSTSVISITGLWDLSGSIGEVMKKNNDYLYPLDTVGSSLKSNNLNIAALATPLSVTCENNYNCASDNSAQMFIKYNIGPVALLGSADTPETRQILAREKINYIAKNHVTSVTSQNINYTFILYSGDDFKKDVDLARANHTDVVVAMLDQPSVTGSHLAIDWGADAVINFSDQIGGLEFYQGKLIILGTGPFITPKMSFPFGRASGLTSEGLETRLYFFGKRLVDVELNAVSSGYFDNQTNYVTWKVAGIKDVNLQNQVKDLVSSLSKQ